MALWIRRWAPAALWAALIWFFSTRYFSAEATASWIEPVLRKIGPALSKEAIELIHHVIRKAAHFTEYFVFSLLVLRALRGERPSWRLKWAVVAVATAACYAGIDEIHQAFVATRTASARDSLLDTSGALAAQLVEWGRTRKSPQPQDEETPKPG